METIGIHSEYRRQTILQAIEELKVQEYSTPRNFQEFRVGAAFHCPGLCFTVPRPLRISRLQYEIIRSERIISYCKRRTCEGLGTRLIIVYELSLLWYTVLYCYTVILWYTVVYCGILWYIVIYCGILWYAVVYCDILWHTMVYCCTVLHCGILLYCVILWYTVVYYYML